MEMKRAKVGEKKIFLSGYVKINSIYSFEKG